VFHSLLVSIHLKKNSYCKIVRFLVRSSGWTTSFDLSEVRVQHRNSRECETERSQNNSEGFSFSLGKKIRERGDLWKMR